jgi:rhomboid protease GluP
MEIIKTEKENWLTKKAPFEALTITILSLIFLIITSTIYQNGIFQSLEWIPASYQSVFIKHEYWRLWTTLFAHADIAHTFGNIFLYVPFAYFLTAHFSILYFPFFGILVGGLINALVIATMPKEVQLIGISGVVYWMGATYLTLAFLIDRRESWQKRMMKISGVALIIFFPETFKVEVSYLSHFVGFMLGILTAIIIYYLFKSQIQKSVVYDYKIEYEQDEIDILSNTNVYDLENH